MSKRVRGAAAAAAAAAEQDLSARCREVLDFLQKGKTRDAIRLAHNLIKHHPDSAMAYNLRGYVLLVAGYESQSAPVLETIHQSAEEAYGTASNLETKCAVTAVSHGKALAVCDRQADAYSEFCRAKRILHPVDPARTHYRLAKELQADDPDSRRAAAAQKASDELMMFRAESEDTIHRECIRLVKMHDEAANSVDARHARVGAQVLASRFPFSCRAQVLFPYFILKYVADLPPGITKKPFYQRALRHLQDAIDTSPSSLVLCIMRAEILFAMGRFADAEQECSRGLDMTLPNDPMEEDIPPGKFFKKTKFKRIEAVTEALANIADKVKDQLALIADLSQEGLNEEEEEFAVEEDEHQEQVILNPPHDEVQDEQLHVALGHLNIAPLKDKQQIKQSLIYNNRKRRKTPAAPIRPEQVVGSKVVSCDVVDQYAEYCYLMETCSAKKVVCQLCVFEKGIYHRNAHIKRDMILHGQAHGSTIKCNMSDCEVRLRNVDDQIIHAHFCHSLPEGWWKKW